MAVSEGKILGERVPRPTLHPSNWTPRLGRIQAERDPNRTLSPSKCTAPQFGRAKHIRHMDRQFR